jgi:hypothetical protein
MAAESERRDDAALTGGQWWISLNVARTRVSLLGFNLSVIAFLIGLLLTAFEGQAFTHHLPAMSSLFVGFCLSIIAAAFLLASQELDLEGLSRPWLFSIGDVCMYLALSQSIAGLTRKYLGGIQKGIEAIHATHPGATLGDFLGVALMLLSLLAWALTMYVGPCISISRSPLRKRERGVLWGIYASLVLMIFLIATQAHQLQDVVLDEPESVLSIFAWQFLQPLTW